MTGVRKPTRILALPVFRCAAASHVSDRQHRESCARSDMLSACNRRNWLYAVEESVEDLKKLPSWRTGRTLVEKARLGQAELLQEVLLSDTRICKC